MALVFGTPTIGYNATHANNVKTFAHTCSSGDDTYLFVVINCQGGYGAPNSTATYNGTAMTVEKTLTIQGLGDAIIIYSLANPDAGASHNVVITGLSAVSNDLSWFAISATGCSGLKQSPVFNTSTSSPITATFASDITEGSTILVAASGRLTLTNGSEIEIPQNTGVTLDQGPNPSPTGTLPTGEYALSYEEAFSAGSLTIETNHDNTSGFNYSGILGIEIGEVAVAGGAVEPGVQVGFNF